MQYVMRIIIVLIPPFLIHSFHFGHFYPCIIGPILPFRTYHNDKYSLNQHRSSHDRNILRTLMTLNTKEENKSDNGTYTNNDRNRKYQIMIQEYIPTHQPDDVYNICLYGWRHDNFHLPLVPPIIIQYGNISTGVDFCLLRIPPFGLKEQIIQYHRIRKTSSMMYHNNTNSSRIDHIHNNEIMVQMYYRVKNPSWLTWPVQYHLGCISFSNITQQTKSPLHINVSSTDMSYLLNSNNMILPTKYDSGCIMQWDVQWIPIPLPSILQQSSLVVSIYHTILQYLTKQIIYQASQYIILKCERIVK